MAPKAPDSEDPPLVEAARARILDAAARLLAQGDREALTTRAVSAAAGVQAPTIYRLFGDKRGLLDAVAERGMARYVADKAARATHPDALEDFRAGWDLHVAFGLEHPSLFAIVSGDPRPGQRSPAAEAGLVVLRARIRRLAAAGLLRVSEERAMGIVQAAGIGTVLTLLAEPAPQRDAELAATMRETVIAAITSAAPVSKKPGAQGAAIALRASLAELAELAEIDRLSPGEQHLLGELLDRIAARSTPATRTPAKTKAAGSRKR